MKEQLIMPMMILELELELDHQQNISFRIRYMALDWMDCNTGTGSSDDHAFTNSLYETSNVHTEDQLRHPSVSPPSHTVKTGTQDLTSTLDEP